MNSDGAKIQDLEAGSAEFDAYAGCYENLLRDPLRDHFSSGKSHFFPERKRDLITRWLSRHAVETSRWSYLDVGCGRGELLELLAPQFATAKGCDTSIGMLESVNPSYRVLQKDPSRLPFADGSFDFVTAVCVYHHIPPADRPTAMREIHRVLKPGALCCVVEHNPLNPITQLIVSRTPVDAGAVLLSHWQTRALMRACGIQPEETSFFMYLPEPLYRSYGGVEESLRWLPLGGQYAVFGRRVATVT